MSPGPSQASVSSPACSRILTPGAENPHLSSRPGWSRVAASRDRLHLQKRGARSDPREPAMEPSGLGDDIQVSLAAMARQGAVQWWPRSPFTPVARS